MPKSTQGVWWWVEARLNPVLLILTCANSWGPDSTGWQTNNLPCHPPRLRLSPAVEPSSTVVSLEWVDVQPAIGTKVSDYILQHKKVDEYTDTDLYTGKQKVQDFLFR